MPLYEYYCDYCETDFTELRNMSDSAKSAPCPMCQADARRVFLSAPRLNTMAPATRKAHQTNERSSHEPRRTGHVCGSHCHHHKKPAEETGNVMKQQTGKGRRPWMLGH